MKKPKKPILDNKPKKANLFDGSGDYLSVPDIGFDLASGKDWQMTTYRDHEGKYHFEFTELKPTKTKGKWMQFKLGRKYTEFIEEQAKNTHKDKQGKKNP